MRWGGEVRLDWIPDMYPYLVAEWRAPSVKNRRGVLHADEFESFLATPGQLYLHQPRIEYTWLVSVQLKVRVGPPTRHPSAGDRQLRSEINTIGFSVTFNHSAKFHLPASRIVTIE